LGLATPTAVTVGIGRGAELGILIRNGEALELSEKVDTMVLDKTGTLTEGRPDVVDVWALDATQDELLTIAASLEKNSQHPLAEAITRHAQQNKVVFLPVTHFDTIEGKGVKGQLNGKTILVGSLALIEENNVRYPADLKPRISSIEEEGKSITFVANDGKLIGIIGVADAVKATTIKAIEELKKLGLEVIMVTGDNKRTANAVANKVGIKRVLAEVLPQDKSAEVKRIQENKRVVSFVGDGINDAPALAQADVGIAIGSGTDIAIESGDIILIRSDLLDAAAAIQLGRKVMSRIKQNLFWAFAYNTALIPVAAGLLYPVFRIAFRPELAGFAMAMSSVTVITLSLLLKGYVPAAKKGSISKEVKNGN